MIERQIQHVGRGEDRQVVTIELLQSVIVSEVVAVVVRGHWRSQRLQIHPISALLDVGFGVVRSRSSVIRRRPITVLTNVRDTVFRSFQHVDRHPGAITTSTRYAIEVRVVDVTTAQITELAPRHGRSLLVVSQSTRVEEVIPQHTVSSARRTTQHNPARAGIASITLQTLDTLNALQALQTLQATITLRTLDQTDIDELGASPRPTVQRVFSDVHVTGSSSGTRQVSRSSYLTDDLDTRTHRAGFTNIALRALQTLRALFALRAGSASLTLDTLDTLNTLVTLESAGVEPDSAGPDIDVVADHIGVAERSAHRKRRYVCYRTTDRESSALIALVTLVTLDALNALQALQALRARSTLVTLIALDALDTLETLRALLTLRALD